MKYQTIEEVYAVNDKIRAKFLQLIESLSNEQANALPEGEKWTITQIVEHVSIVEESMSKITYKLLKEAKAGGKASDGTVMISDSFSQNAAESRGKKLVAPDRVHPTGSVSLADSIKKLEENRRKLYELKPIFETIDCSEHKFPHPSFGELTAHEWLTLIGGHESRHIEQIKKRL